MKFNIFLKVFLAMLASMVIVVAAMMASTQWSFHQGLAEYIHQVELKRLETLLPRLAQAHQEHGGWDFLRGNRHDWIRLLRHGLDQDRSHAVDLTENPPVLSAANPALAVFPDLPPELGEPPRPPAGLLPGGAEPPPLFPRHGRPPLNDPWFLGGRLRLLDADRRYVVGPPFDGPESLRPILRNNQIIGWLAIRPSGVVNDHLALAFMHQQRQANRWIAALALGLSMLASWLLARVFLAPIKRLATGAQSLAAGHYDTQIQPTGHDELGQLATHFNLLAQTLASNETARRLWIADISHELRTPLAILQGEIEALQDGIRTPTPARLRSLHGETVALAKLVDDLHELSLSDLGAMAYRRERVDLVELLAEVCANFRPRFDGRGLALRYPASGPAHLMVFADRSRLFQLVANLLENSVRYTDSPGSCEITLSETATACCVDVCDSAPGVPDEALGKLFERLYRVDKSRSRELGGSGLGLAICKNIAEAHGGAITARHSDQGGLWIRLELPKPIA